jgi:tetratricopeptide (TPR) repeat protein
LGKTMLLPDSLHEEVVALSKEGDDLAEDRRFDAALAKYHAAFRLLPEPKEAWLAATWLLTAIGDSHYLSGHAEEAAAAFSRATHCPDAIGNPFLHLRLGQCRLALGDEAKAADELTRAYALGGVEVFEDEDPRFLEFLNTKIIR